MSIRRSTCLHVQHLGWRTVMTDDIGVTRWQYSPLGDVEAVTDPFNKTVNYTHDGQSNRLSLTYPDGKQAFYRYDSLGRLERVTDWNGQIVAYTYDAASQLRGVSLPNGVQSALDYDPAGQLTSLTHITATGQLAAYAYVYDLAGNRTMVTETLYLPAYPQNFPLISRSGSGGGASGAGGSAPLMQSAYPAPQQAAPAMKSPKPYPAPETKGAAAFWQALASFFSGLFNWGVTPASAHPLPSAPALLTPEGFVQQTVIHYTYDPLARLTDAHYSGGAVYHYGYNAAGNRTWQQSPYGSTSYLYDDANRLKSVNGIVYTWDANGNLLSDGMRNYEYDHANRLSRIKRGGITLSSYSYSGLGDRLAETQDGALTHFTLDLASGLTQVLEDGTSTYLYGPSTGPGGRIAQYRGDDAEYFLGDALGSVRQLTDAQGKVFLGKNYQPFGEELPSPGTGKTSYGFTGEWSEAGLVYLRARYYSSQQGRFISRDTWGGDTSRPLTLNRWNYAESEPVNRVDPSGHWTLELGNEGRWGIWAVREPGDTWYSLFDALGIDQASLGYSGNWGEAPKRVSLDKIVDPLIRQTALFEGAITPQPSWIDNVNTSNIESINCYPTALSCSSGLCLFSGLPIYDAADTILTEIGAVSIPVGQVVYGDIVRIGGDIAVPVKISGLTVFERLQNKPLHFGMVILRNKMGSVWTFNAFPVNDPWSGYRIIEEKYLIQHFETRPVHILGPLWITPTTNVGIRGKEGDRWGYYRFNLAHDEMLEILIAHGAAIFEP